MSKQKPILDKIDYLAKAIVDLGNIQYDLKLQGLLTDDMKVAFLNLGTLLMSKARRLDKQQMKEK